MSFVYLQIAHADEHRKLVQTAAFRLLNDQLAALRGVVVRSILGVYACVASLLHGLGLGSNLMLGTGSKLMLGTGRKLMLDIGSKLMLGIGSKLMLVGGSKLMLGIGNKLMLGEGIKPMVVIGSKLIEDST